LRPAEAVREGDAGEPLEPSITNAHGEVAASFADVSFTYPSGTLALSNVNLEVEAGRVLGVVGPSGCGKSTLLSLLAGLALPTAGVVTLNKNAAGVGRHGLSMVFQKDTLLPWLTVQDNVGFYYRLHRKERGRAAELVPSLLELARVSDFARAYPYQLSGGMRRRVAFLAAVAAMPAVLLLDEPFSSLDEPTRVALHQDVFEIIRRLQMTVVLVTHDLAEAVSMCDDVVILTNRPGSVARRVPIPFGLHRNLFDLRQTPEFLRLYGVLWHDLSEQIRRQPAPGSAEPAC
jgi:ABC-type nitrate/sulfonate/bicarbonate transport system ATPase subunit